MSEYGWRYIPLPTLPPDCLWSPAGPFIYPVEEVTSDGVLPD